MQTKFIKTQNVKRFISLMDNLQKAPPNVPKIALVYGEFGLGKSQAIMWWVTNNDAIYVRCNHKMTSRWLLSEIVKELDEEPCRQSSHLFRQIEDKLKTEPKAIIVDEIDYLFTNTHTIETLSLIFFFSWSTSFLLLGIIPLMTWVIPLKIYPTPLPIKLPASLPIDLTALPAPFRVPVKVPLLSTLAFLNLGAAVPP